MKIVRQIVVSIGVSAMLLLAIAVPAAAHVGVEADATAAGSTAMVTFGFGHGCDGASTTSIEIQIPDEFEGVTPVFASGWTIEKISEPLATPASDAHGNTSAERVASVEFTADKPIEDGIYAMVSLRLILPEGAEGETIYFPTIQTCETGETAWIEIPAEGQDLDDLESPAPGFEITAPEEGDGH